MLLNSTLKHSFKNNQQKGVSLVITFLIMTIMLAIILSVATILFNKIKLVGDLESSVSAFNAAGSGLEKTLYFDQKQIPGGSQRGICAICSTCSPSDCTSCSTTPLVANGCNAACTNCEIKYSSAFDGRSFNADIKVTPNASAPTLSDTFFSIDGYYRNTKRTVTKLVQPGFLKIVENANGVQTFHFTVAGLTPSSDIAITTPSPIGGTASVTLTVNAADVSSMYTVTQINTPPGWTLFPIICDRGIPTLLANGASNITVAAGEITTCNFHNCRPGTCL